MYIPFEKIHDRARIWIYQGNRNFNSDDSKIISQALLSFTEGWLVHGSPVHASFDVRYNQFVILAADEEMNSASGCSIDDSVRTLKKVGAQLNINFFDRSVVAFKKGEEVITLALADLKEKLKEGIWNKDSLVFNNLVGTKGDLSREWLAPAASTWLKRYLPTQTVVS